MKENPIKQHAIHIPELTAKNADAEPWRIQRLKRIVGQLNSFAYGQIKYDLLKKIVHLHDENNMLKITWASEPSTAERMLTREVCLRNLKVQEKSLGIFSETNKLG